MNIRPKPQSPGDGLILANMAPAGSISMIPSGTKIPGEYRIFTITQYNSSVKKKIETAPRIWVQGVITQLNTRGRVTYVTIGEFEEGNPNPKAVLQVTLWSSELEVYNLRFANLPVPFSLKVELKVSVLLEAFFYIPLGRFQPKVINIDENFTLGELSRTRQKILAMLVREGLLEKNKKIAMSPIPLQVGLITAPGSAAYQDFTTILLNSGYAFQIHFSPAKMQGDETEPTVLASLKRLCRLPLDVICIVRGGGAKTDLIYFDSEAICMAIAGCPIPVLTGIGHEIDNSLADLVAHADKLTPTDCAKFLENRLAGCFTKLGDFYTDINELWHLILQQSKHDLADRATTLRHCWESRRSAEHLQCAESWRLMRKTSGHLIDQSKQHLRRNRIGLKRGPEKILEMQNLKFLNKVQRFEYVWENSFQAAKSQLADMHLILKGKLGVVLSRDSAKLTRLWEEIGPYSGRAIKSGWEVLIPKKAILRSIWKQSSRANRANLQLKERLVNARDPANMLQLGYSILRDSNGALIRNLSQMKPGDLIYNKLQDGVVESKVTDQKVKEKKVRHEERNQDL